MVLPAGRVDEDDVVSPARRSPAPFDVLLAFYIGKVDVVDVLGFENSSRVKYHLGFDLEVAAEEVHRFPQAADAEDIQSVDDGGFPGVLFGQDEALPFLSV